MCFITKRDVNYTSEITRFILELKEKNPFLEEEQRAGRKLLWDKEPIDLEQITRDKKSEIKQRPYVYQDY